MKQHIISLRILATLAVIALHVSAPLLRSFESNGIEAWWYGNVIDGLTRWCVPVFFMISGALLLTKEESMSSFYKKRFQKIMIPFAFWVVFYVLYERFVENIALRVLILKIFEKPYFHLWFLYALVGIYLVTPFLQRWLKVTSKHMVLCLLLFWSINEAIFPMVNKITGIKIGFEIPVMASYLGFFIWGYYLETYKPRIHPIFIAVAGGITVMGTYALTKQNGGVFDGYFYGYATLNVLMMAIALYVLMQRRPLWIPFQSFLDRHSFGVYLIHAFVLLGIDRWLNIQALWIHPLLGIPITVVCILTISYTIVWIISKIPIIKQIV